MSEVHDPGTACVIDLPALLDHSKTFLARLFVVYEAESSSIQQQPAALNSVLWPKVVPVNCG